jgi:uncharacterized protein
MPETIPLFPLGSVLFPGALLPLHVFEERYRELVGTLLRRPEAERYFGVVAIRQGFEVGQDAVRAVYQVGTVAELREVSRHADGRYDLVVHGADRFRLLSVDTGGRPYLQGEVELLPPEPPADAEATVLARSVARLFDDYVAALAATQGAQVAEHTLPNDPTVLSYLVAATALLTLEDRQLLLETGGTAERLRREARLLRRETTLVRTLRVVPAPLRELQVPESRN